MLRQIPGRRNDPFEERSRALFHDSVEGLDFAQRSRLTRARHAAIDAAASARAQRWYARKGVLMPVGMSAAAILGAVLWLGSPSSQLAVTVTDGQPNLEDLEMVASADGSSGDAMDLLEDDIEFYDWADKAASQAPAAQG